MKNFVFKETGIKDLLIIEPIIFGDKRGFFMEVFNYEKFRSAGLELNFVQDNVSKSVKGVLRGLHFQYEKPQGKLVRVIKGKIFDVAVDLRKESATFGKHYGIILSEENKKQLYIPEGFAHGFYVISEEVEFMYKCTNYYHPEKEGGIIWNDPDLNIKWPVTNINSLILSEKDIKLKNFKEINYF